jgi:oxygen-independent coproporphyrinogen-3 oxidase
MRGIYIHIPFCRQACRYCDFFFSVSLRYLDNFVDGLVEEIHQKGTARRVKGLDTLYFGGGTPSLLTEAHLDRILSALSGFYSFRKGAEWTIECNPDDLDEKRLKHLKSMGFNRLSMGVQSFHEQDLDLLRRSHNARQAEESVQNAAAVGFGNISIDLIYGIPGQSKPQWEDNIQKALKLPVSHLSAYHLSFEPGTVFDHWRKKGRLLPVHEEDSVWQYKQLRKEMIHAGFEHYELSNFGRAGFRSAHNMLYWSGEPYLGFGPSAHSFDGLNRSWNRSSLKGYLEGVNGGEEFSETEILSTDERYHDYLITSLRTQWGCDPARMEKTFGAGYREHFEKKARPFLEAGSLYEREGRIAIQPESWMIADHILRELFVD